MTEQPFRPETEAGGIPDDAARLIHWVGRFDRRDPSRARFSWPGSAIYAAFTGTGIRARLGDSGTNFFSVVIDDGPPTALATSGANQFYIVASDLSPGRHTLAMTKRTEAALGSVELRALSPIEGALLASPPPFSRRIEFIGDSITCGYGILGDSPTCAFSPDTEDETVAFGALTARALGAATSVIAYSGIGMYRNGSGSRTSTMPDLFGRTLAADPFPWDFRAAPEPDVVVINLGTNDFAHGDPGAPFEQAYAEFLVRLRGHYPSAAILCTLSPMLSDVHTPGARLRTLAGAAIESAVQSRVSAGDARVSYFVFGEIRPEEGYGCDYHPSAATHRRMATALTEALRTRLGW